MLLNFPDAEWTERELHGLWPAVFINQQLAEDAAALLAWDGLGEDESDPEQMPVGVLSAHEGERHQRQVSITVAKGLAVRSVPAHPIGQGLSGSAHDRLAEGLRDRECRDHRQLRSRDLRQDQNVGVEQSASDLG